MGLLAASMLKQAQTVLPPTSDVGPRTMPGRMRHTLANENCSFGIIVLSIATKRGAGNNEF